MPVRFTPTCAPRFEIVVERFPGLRRLQMWDAIASLTEGRLRRLRRDLEDKADAIRLPMPS